MAEARFTWTEQAIEILKTMYGAGDAFSAIARVLGTTRNACIGKANRLGLSQRAFKPDTKKAALVRRAPPATSALAAPALRRAEADPVSIVTPPAPKPRNGVGVTIDQLEHPDIMIRCRYPLGDPMGAATIYCGDTTTEVGNPYCSTHQAMCWIPAPKCQPRPVSTLSSRRTA